MIEAIIAGRLVGKPSQKTAKTGKPFATAKLRAPAGDDTVFISVVAFDANVCAGLLALDDGDTVALSGPLIVKAWLNREGEPKPGIDMVAHALLTAYHVSRKRKAQAGAQQAQQAQQQRQREPLDAYSEREGLGDW